MRRTEEERATALAGLRDILGPDPAAAPALHTLTTYGRGETDWVRVYVMGKAGRTADSPPRMLSLTWHLGVLLDDRVVPHKGVPFGGGQYNKALEAVTHLWRFAYGSDRAVPDDYQLTHWYELT